MTDQLSVEDLAEIRQTLALYPHVFDNKDIDGLGLVFTKDATAEMTRGAGSIRRGLDAIAEFVVGLSEDAPDHLTLNTVVFVDDEGVVRARSRYLAILADQSMHDGDYFDVLVRTEDGWRISYRISVPRFPRGEQVPPSQEAVDAWRRWVAGQQQGAE